MAQRVGRWLSVGKLIELFTAMGCELRFGRGHFDTEEGRYQIRYLYSPATTDFVSLSDLADDELISPLEIENWERRLGTLIPKGNSN